jgi:hypothetical protein
MYACVCGIGRGFFAGVCALNDQACISSDPTPTLPFVDRFMPVLSLSKQVSASHRRDSLFTVPHLVLGNKLQSGEMDHPPLP